MRSDARVERYAACVNLQDALCRLSSEIEIAVPRREAIAL